MNHVGATVIAIVLSSAASGANAQDTVRIEQLRQDVSELNRTVREQARRIDRLEREIARLRAAAAGRSPRAKGDGSTESDFEAAWLQASAWDEVRSGMSEREVVARLGPPTAIRAENIDAKTLLYTLELAGTGFLTGSVRLAGGRVAEVRKPQLR